MRVILRISKICASHLRRLSRVRFAASDCYGAFSALDGSRSRDVSASLVVEGAKMRRVDAREIFFEKNRLFSTCRVRRRGKTRLAKQAATTLRDAFEVGSRTENRFEKNFRKFFSSRVCASRCERSLSLLHRCEALARDALAPGTVVEHFDGNPSLVLRARQRGEDRNEIGRAHARARAGSYRSRGSGPRREA